VLSFAATTNNDRVGLLIFTDQVELYIPPRKGRKHVLRLLRELLAFEPRRRGTDIKLALDTVNHVMKRRGIVFLVSDFMANPDSYRTAMAVTNRRHDLIAVDLHDPRELSMVNVGLLAMEDPETGEVAWVDTASSAGRSAFQRRMEAARAGATRAFRQAGVDRIDVATDRDYVAPLTAFFQDRYRRIRH
jgi:uncharacterized protein (DUF58 family)